MLWSVAATRMEELAQRLQQLETQVGQQRAVIEHQQEQLMHEQTTIDAERAARTPVTAIALDARGNLVGLRVGDKPETFAGETHEWEGWSFKMRQYVAVVDEELYIVAIGRNERASEETSETACVHVDDAHERPSTPDDHKAERSSEWIRNLETFPGRVGDDTQRTVPSDAGTVAAVSVYGRPRSGLGGVGTTRATVRGTEFRHASGHDPSSNTGTQRTRSRNWRRHVGLNATRLQGYDANRSEWKAMQQAYRQWGIADGNDTTPLEVDALRKGKEKGKGKEQGQREKERERQAKQRARTSRRKERQTRRE